MASDELDFPTAIVPTRPGSAPERFRRYTRAFGDPMGVLFREMATATAPRITAEGTVVEEPDRETRRECAKELMPYGYPKLRTTDLNLGAAGAGGGGVSVTINIGGPAPQLPPTIDVTPSQAPQQAPEDDPLA